MKIKLNIIDRLSLLQVLPREGNYAILKRVNVLRDELEFTIEERATYGIKTSGTQVIWNKDFEVEIEIGAVCEKVIREKFKELDETNKLLAAMVSVYEKILGIKDEKEKKIEDKKEVK